MLQGIMSLMLAFSLATILPSASHAKWGFFKKDKMVEELDLTDEQKNKVKEIREKYKTELKGQKEALREQKKDLKKALQSPEKGEAYRQQLLEKFDKLEATKAAQERKRFEMALEVREILDAKQIEKFKGLRDDKFGKKHKHED